MRKGKIRNYIFKTNRDIEFKSCYAEPKFKLFAEFLPKSNERFLLRIIERVLLGGPDQVCLSSEQPASIIADICSDLNTQQACYVTDEANGVYDF